MMGKCKSASHKMFKDKEKNRVDDLHGMLTDLQFARKESRAVDMTVLEEQVHQMMREWKAELIEPSPASSLQHCIPGYNSTDLYVDSGVDQLNSFLPSICPPPSAFLGPKCALWDCPRPSQGGLDWCQDYCSSFHHALALHESPIGMAPVLRPGGIGLKDSLLFAALSAKAQGKIVGIPECEGAATAKSPWNAPELFELTVLEGETLREWLFFDKPHRAFESGNRKQRSLPDYCGRGWHESRKQVMNEHGGLKRSYYMDPQPLSTVEWHLYEYEINKCDVCASYRLELKAVDGKKNSKGKLSNDSVADLQKQMGRLSADFPTENKRSFKGRAKANGKAGAGNVYAAAPPNRVPSANESFDYGVSSQYDYLVDNLGDYLAPKFSD